MSALDRPRPARTPMYLTLSLFVGALLIFLIPGACLGFVYYTSIQAPISDFQGLAHQYQLDRWSVLGAVISLGITVTIILQLLTGIAFSRRSPGAFYWNLRIGWQTLRLFTAVQALLQGALVVCLTVVVCEWFGVPADRIAIAVGIVILALAGLVIRAIFKNYSTPHDAEGRCISKEEAPALWNRVKEMAARMHTTPPERIVAGIDARFFVTGGPLMVDGKKLEGRSLYLSLPLLKAMTVEEADAILGHEMAHFSGNDTEFSQRLAPLLHRYDCFTAGISNGLMSPVSHFMNVFRCLYLKNLGHYSRQREFRADRIGANFTNPAAFGRALIKFIAYSRWRGSLEAATVTAGVEAGDVSVRERIEAGFAEALCGFMNDAEALAADAPHPFDIHPPLSDRLAALDLEPELVLGDPRLLQAPANSWYYEIAVAEVTENSLWSRHQESLDKVRDAVAAITMIPEDPAQEAVLKNAYPLVTFACGKKTALLEHDCIGLSQWDAPVFFNDIVECSYDSFPGVERLTIITREAGGRPVKHKFYPKKYKGASGDLLEAFQTYYGRYRAAVEHRKNHTEGFQSAPAPAGSPHQAEAMAA